MACGLLACASAPPRSTAQREADEATAARVQAALAAQQDLDSKQMVVSVYDGVVKLSGLAWSTDAIYTAARVAGAVPGVKSVTNELSLESSQFGR
jgi:osmotically-inducible protein OsmY